MTQRVEPPVLMSRLLIFVFAALLVVLIALFFTLYNMFPLNRPQVFLLQTNASSDTTIVVGDLPPQITNIETFRQEFVKEYTRARNEIVPRMDEMLTRWDNKTADGVINVWSAPNVYAEFLRRGMVRYMMNNPTVIPTCSLDIIGLKRLTTDIDASQQKYQVDFSYICSDKDNYGQAPKKNYTIEMTVQMEGRTETQWTDRLHNPLGMQVTEYKVLSANGDPLDSGWLQQKVK